jgi:hypothetical protein
MGSRDANGATLRWPRSISAKRAVAMRYRFFLLLQVSSFKRSGTRFAHTLSCFRLWSVRRGPYVQMKSYSPWPARKAPGAKAGLWAFLPNE